MGEREELAERLTRYAERASYVSLSKANDLARAATLLTEGPRLAFRWEGYWLRLGSAIVGSVRLADEGGWEWEAHDFEQIDIQDRLCLTEAEAKAALEDHITEQVTPLPQIKEDGE